MGNSPHSLRIDGRLNWGRAGGAAAQSRGGGPVPVVPLKEILDHAFAHRYGVAAFNILDDLSIEAVLAAAEEERAPVILQTSVKTVRSYGRDRLMGVFRTLVADVTVPVTLHLDHCPDRAVISDCLDGGWNSVLFDAHELDVAENLRQTTEVVAEARGHGAHVEGEIEGIQGVEDGVGSDDVSVLQSLDVAVDFIKRTGVDCFAPAIGNAHGQYTAAPKLNHQRVTDLVEATGVPMALHGGTGLSPDQFRDLIGRGCAKVNISTALKETYMRSALEHLRGAEEKGKWDPSSLFAHQRAAVVGMAREHIALFGGSGRAA
jgi:fructose-bisphosphate aldolase, class II